MLKGATASERMRVGRDEMASASIPDKLSSFDLMPILFFLRWDAVSFHSPQDQNQLQIIINHQ